MTRCVELLQNVGTFTKLPTVCNRTCKGLFILLLCACFVNAPTSLAWEIPYGVQDPFQSPGFPACKGGEIGHWNVIKRTVQGREVIFLLLTTIDLADPAYTICWQPGEFKIMALGAEKQL